MSTGSTDRARLKVLNEYQAVDLLTGQLVVTLTDGAKFASVYDLADHDRIYGHRWRVNVGGYLITDVGGRKTGRTVFLHRMLLGLDRGVRQIGDHINGDRLDNRQENLRTVDMTINALNQAVINERGTSIYRGVCWDRRAGKWKAAVQVDGRCHDLGHFGSEVAAADAAIDFRAKNGIELGYPRRHPHTPSKASHDGPSTL